MATQFYGNEETQRMLYQMLERSRAAQGLLFYGEAGLGKKTLALRFAAAMLCSEPEAPCGTCRSCRMIRDGVHPDVQIVPHSGKRGGFSVDTVRKIGTDLAVPPNEGAAKFYLFGDCDTMDPRAQNLLLKSIEEPPAYAYFLFTATSPMVLLPTVRSRIVSLPVMPVSEQACMKALLERQYTPEQCQTAMDAFHGNIGQCIRFLEEPDVQEIVGLTKSAINSIINRDEYAMLKTIFAVEKDREKAGLFLTLMERTVRDALAWKADSTLPGIGCDASGARQLAQTLSTAAGQAIHQAVYRAVRAMDANVNLSLVMTAFGAACFHMGG